MSDMPSIAPAPRPAVPPAGAPPQQAPMPREVSPNQAYRNNINAKMSELVRQRNDLYAKSCRTGISQNEQYMLKDKMTRIDQELEMLKVQFYAPEIIEERRLEPLRRQNEVFQRQLRQLGGGQG